MSLAGHVRAVRHTAAGRLDLPSVRDALQARLELPLLAWLLDLPRGGRVLEVGCGGGNALRVLARLLRPRVLVGIDLDRSLLARSPTGAFDLAQADLLRLPFPDGCFDLVLDFGTCYQVRAASGALAEIERVLRPGGLFVHETPLAQLVAHPWRSTLRGLPWSSIPDLVRGRALLLWAVRRRVPVLATASPAPRPAPGATPAARPAAW